MAGRGPWRSANNGIIYFALNERSAAIKIGWCIRDPYERIKVLQVGSPEEIKLVGCIPKCSVTDEKDLHYAFKDSRIRGEWFSITQELLDLIGAEAMEFYPDDDWSGTDAVPVCTWSLERLISEEVA